MRVPVHSSPSELSSHQISPSARDYCKKGELSKEAWDADGDRAKYFGLNADYWETGKFVTNGERTDLQKLREVIEEAPTFRDVLRQAE